MVGYTFSPSVEASKTLEGKWDVGCRVTFVNDDGVEQFIEHRVWLTGLSDFQTACEFAHQTVKFMLAYYERMIRHIVERLVNNEQIISINSEGSRSESDTERGLCRTDQGVGLVTDCQEG